LLAYISDDTGRAPADIQMPATFTPGSVGAFPGGTKVFRIAGQADFAALTLPNILLLG